MPAFIVEVVDAKRHETQDVFGTFELVGDHDYASVSIILYNKATGERVEHEIAECGDWEYGDFATWIYHDNMVLFMVQFNKAKIEVEVDDEPHDIDALFKEAVMKFYQEHRPDY